MIKLIKRNKTPISIFVALTLTGCVGFDTRMKANGPFDYTDEKQHSDYDPGEFKLDEKRDTFKTPKVSEQLKSNSFITNDLDIRPPTQIILPIEGVLLDSSSSKYSKVWFSNFNQGENLQLTIWNLINEYLSINNVRIENKNTVLREIQTATFVEEKYSKGSALSENNMERKASYFISLDKASDNDSIALSVQLLTFSEVNNGVELPYNYSDISRRNVELRFINNLLAYAFEQQKVDALNALDSKPLPLKLGFDDNHQIAWLVDTEFTTTWLKLPAIFELLNFEVIESDENLGYFLLKFTQPDDDYWPAHNLNAFELPQAEYFVQLGESIGGNTSIVWLDEDKKALSDKQVTDIYLSISEQVRDVLLLKNKQTKPL